MIVSKNNQRVEYLSPVYVGKEISVGIDSSKRNTAIAIGDSQCRLLDVYELNGKFDGTSEMDTLVLCQQHRNFLKVLLTGSKPKIVGIENIITVDKGSKETGISQHMSRFKITAVFMSLITFFQDTFNITPELVNNQTWKSVVLPKEFTLRSVHKGSLAYFTSINSPYKNYTDDATDAICILRYLQTVHNLEDINIVRTPEIKCKEYSYAIFEKDLILDSNATIKFRINEELSIEDNTTVMANSLYKFKYAAAVVPIHYFTIEQIYKLAQGRFSEYVTEVLLVVKEK